MRSGASAAAPRFATRSRTCGSTSGKQPGELRAGWQVINWGESTFIQGGINAINPFDVAVLRVPGAELRDALLPVGAVKFSVKPSSSTSIEVYYQYDVGRPEDRPGRQLLQRPPTWRAAGATKVMLGFGAAPDTIPVGTPVPGNPIGVAVPRTESREADQQGQYGAALRVLADGLAGTEFGLYFVNYHSRLPLIMAKTGTANGLLVSGNYAGSAQYFLVYPEDIKLFGASFNTQLPAGIALQGEISHRRDLPLQVDDVELLFAALSPLRLLPAIPQLAPVRAVGALLASTNNQLGAYGFNEEIQGYSRFDTTQVQAPRPRFSAASVAPISSPSWPKPAGARCTTCRAERAPPRGPGTYTSGNPVFTRRRVQPGTEPASAFPTSSAWGYVVAGRFEYNNAIGAVNCAPLLVLAGRERYFARPGRQLPRRPQGPDGRARRSSTRSTGSSDPELLELLRRWPVQPLERPRFRRGQHQVFLLRLMASCAARHGSSRPLVAASLALFSPAWRSARPSRAASAPA
jgi:hypothetical protein